MASDRAIEVRDLHFAYGARRVLDSVSLQVAPGEIVGLLGPNGSGKSTALRTIAGLLGSYSGSVQVLGAQVSQCDRRLLARDLALVPQESLFSFPFSVLEVVLMGRYPHLHGLTFESQQDFDIAAAALARCGAQDLAGRTIHELSSGERQRVVFARALAQQPKVLLLDEPASFLDVKYQVELYDIVRDLAREQACAVLTVLHDFNLAAEYCDTIYLLSKGRIQAGGGVSEVLTYANVKQAFDTEVYVDRNTLTGKPLIVPLSASALADHRG